LYAIYTKDKSDDASRFVFSKQVSLFGCHVGLVPKLLARSVPQNQGEPYCWHLALETSLAAAEHPNSALVIDLKPKQNRTNVSLYELLDVWGYSAAGWTPILLHLSGLFVDAEPSTCSRNDFTVRDNEREGPIYEVLYVNGTVSKGQIVGGWNCPPASPTNGALLWPDTLNYFIECIRNRTPSLVK
jgi:hypothetical protein